MTTPPAVDSGVPFSFGQGWPPQEPVRRTPNRFWTVILVIVVFVAGVAFDQALQSSTTVADPDEFAMITEAWNLLHDEYVDAEHLDPSALAHGAISGMADAVGDTGHTYFLTPGDASYEADLSGESYGGIGVDIDDLGAVPIVTGLVPGGPAVTAGIKVGDEIVAVDGKSTVGPDGLIAIDSIRGVPGSTVTLTVERAGSDTPLRVTVTRAEIEQSYVEWALVPGQSVAVVRLGAFNIGCAQDLRAALQEAKNAEATGLVLDLRGNPGGEYVEALDVASFFLHRSDVVVVERDKAGAEITTKSTQGPVAADIPLVVLVDGDSASAAEVVMGALQDAKRATVIGTTTAGTGTIMDAWDWEDGSELWIGTTRWFTPNGRSAWHVGLKPDVVVERPEDQRPIGPGELASLGKSGVTDKVDVQLRRALQQLAKD